MKLFSVIFFIIFFIGTIFSQVVHIKDVNNSHYNFIEINEKYNISIIGEFLLLISYDNSSTFSYLNIPDQLLIADEYLDAEIINSTTYIIYGKKYFYKTIDSGKNWKKVFQVNNQILINDSEFDEDKILVGVGYNGTTIISYDKGETWILKKISSSNNLNKVKFLKESNSWYIGGDKLYLKSFKFSDSTIAWVTYSLLNNIIDLQVLNGQILELQQSSNNSVDNFIVKYNSSLSPLKKIEVKGKSLLGAKMFSNGDIVCNNENNLFLIEQNSSQLLFVKDSIYKDNSNKSSIKNMNLDKEYLLITGNEGAIGKLNNTTNLLKYIPATFTSNISECMKDSLKANSDYQYADSYEWRLNNELISTSKNIQIKYPEKIGDHLLTLKVVYKNNFDFTSVYFKVLENQFSNLITFPKKDTTLCFGDYYTPRVKVKSSYNDQFYINIFDSTNNSMLLEKQKLNNSTFYGFSKVFKKTTTLLITISGDTKCGYQEEIYRVNLKVREDLSKSFVSLNDKLIFCANEKQIARYILKDTNNIYTLNNIEIQKVNPKDTISQELKYYCCDLYRFAFDKIQSKITQCISYRANNIISDIIIRPFPESTIKFSDNVFLNTDSIDVSDFKGGKKNLLTIHNANNSLVYSDTLNNKISIKQSGKYILNFKTTNEFNCTNNFTKEFYVSERKNQIDTTLCYRTERNDIVFTKTKIDRNQNIIQAGFFAVKSSNVDHNAPRHTNFYLRKLDKQGVLIWEKMYPIDSLKKDVIIKYFFISDIDIDKENNINVLFNFRFTSVNYDENERVVINFGLILDTLTDNKLSRVNNLNYFTKFNEKGEMIVSKKISRFFTGINNFLISNSNKNFYIENSVYQNGIDCFVEIDKQGVHLNRIGFERLWQVGSQYYPPFEGYYKGHDFIDNITDQNPQSGMKQLHNGDFVVYQYYHDQSVNKSIFLTLFDARLNIKKKFYIGENTNIGCIEVDLNDNIYFAHSNTIYKFDKELNLVWKKSTTNLSHRFLKFIPQNNTLIISSYSSTNSCIFDRDKYISINQSKILNNSIIILDAHSGNFLNYFIKKFAQEPICFTSFVDDNSNVYFNEGYCKDLSYYSATRYNEYVSFFSKLSLGNCKSADKIFKLSYLDTIKYCQYDSSESRYAFSISNNIGYDSLKYKIIDNISQLESFDLVSDYTLDIKYSTNSDYFTLITYSNSSIDTFYVKRLLNKKPIFDIPKINCSNATSLIKFDFNEKITIDNSLNYLVNAYNLDLSKSKNDQYLLPYTGYYKNECILNDSLQIVKTLPIKNELLFKTDNCINEIQKIVAKPFDSKHYFSLNNKSSFTTDTDSVAYSKFNKGINQIFVKSIDTNDCILLDSILINHIDNSFTLNKNYKLNCGGNVDIRIPNSMKSVLWSDSTTSFSHNFKNQLPYKNDTLSYYVSSIDSFGCRYLNYFDVIYNCQTNSINQNYFSEKVLYPNPFSDLLYIQFVNSLPKFISIHSQQGNLVYSRNSILDSEELKLDYLASGVYFLTIEEEGNTYTQKIVKL